MTHLNQTEFLPAVVIKDPYSWMGSMCRHKYAVNWAHFAGHCPNLVPTTPEESARVHNEATIKAHVHYNDANTTHHDSLADLWNTWYGDWIDHASFPRLIVRFEDLLFHAEKVVGEICKCGGGVLYDKPFKYSLNSAKIGKVHDGSSGLVKSMSRYSDKSQRVKSFTSKDLTYAVKTLRSDIMDKLGYASPSLYTGSATTE